jgi:hypothetical protein
MGVFPVFGVMVAAVALTSLVLRAVIGRGNGSWFFYACRT